MQAYLYISLEGFYISTLHSLEPDLKSRPLVVTQDRMVIDACPLALNRNIRPGSRLSEAKTVLREQGVYREVATETFQSHQYQWLDECLISSHVIEPETAASAWIDLTGHPQPIEVAHALAKRLSTFPFRLRMGLSCSKWVAKLSANQSEVFDATIDIPQTEWLTDSSAYIKDLPTQALHPVSHANRERLIFLGYRRIGKIAQALPSLLKEQFGADGFSILQAAKGSLHESISPVYPDRSLSESMQFEPELTSKTTIHECMDKIASKVAFALVDQDLLAKHLRVSVEFEGGDIKSFARALGKPIQEATPMRAACRYAMEQFPLEHPVAAIRVLLSSLSPAKRFQRSIDPRWNPTEQQCMIEPAKQRLATQFGEKSLLLASDLVVPRRVRLLRAWQNATGWH